MSIKKSNQFGWGPDCVIPKNRLEFLKSQIKGKKIIDIGCGPGHLLNYLLGFSYLVTGIDKYKYQNKNIIKAQASHLPFPDNSFDTAFLNNVLEHNQNDQQILTEALRVASRVIITVPQNCPDNLKNRGVVYQHYQDRSHRRTYTPKSLRLLARQSNAKVIKIIPLEPLPNRELFSELIKSPILWRKIISRIIFYLFRPQPYYLELAAIIKRK
ncbi:MAG: class I SAM-dependent methyltransferase [Patescibacteria group bacterium]